MEIKGTTKFNSPLRVEKRRMSHGRSYWDKSHPRELDAAFSFGQRGTEVATITSNGGIIIHDQKEFEKVIKEMTKRHGLPIEFIHDGRILAGIDETGRLFSYENGIARATRRLSEQKD